MTGCVFWDTNLLIYWLEGAGPRHETVRRLFDWQERNGLSLVTSSLSLAEILVHPMKSGRSDLARRYARLIDEMGCLPFGSDAAWRFAELRAAHPSLRPPDAIQLACASVHGVMLFVTNDDRLSKVRAPGIDRVTSLDEWIRENP